MGLTYEDIKPRLEALKAKADQERAEQRRLRQGVAKEMSELLADPRWEIYRQHVEKLYTDHESHVKLGADQLLSGRLTPDDYCKVQSIYQYDKGYVNGLKVALDLAVELVKRGSIDTQNNV